MASDASRSRPWPEALALTSLVDPTPRATLSLIDPSLIPHRSDAADDTCYPNNGEGLGLGGVRAATRNRTVEVRSRAESFATHPAVRRAAGQLGLGQLNDYACGAETQMGTWLDAASVQE